jgi:hypothetical protein
VTAGGVAALLLAGLERFSFFVGPLHREGVGCVLPRASDLWVQASLEQRQRLQQVFFPGGVVFDGKRFVRTDVSTHAFRHLALVESSENNLASPRGCARVGAPETFIEGDIAA